MRNSKSKLVWAALAATLLAAYFAPEPRDDVVRPVPARSNTTYNDQPHERCADEKGRQISKPEVLVIRARTSPSSSSGFFSAARWGQDNIASVPTAPEVASVAAENAVPPPPFRVIGRYVDGEKVSIFVEYNDQALAVRIGDMIGGDYRVEAISDRSISVVYLPLNEVQSISVSGGG